MTYRAILLAATVTVVGGCQGGGDNIDADVATRVAYFRGVSWDQGERADYGVDALGHVETGATMRSRALPIERPRPTPHQEFRVLMSGRERLAFDGLHWEPTRDGEMPPVDRFLGDLRSRFLRHHGTRVKWGLLDAGLQPGMGQGAAEALVAKALGSEAAWRDSDDDDHPGLTSSGEIDYSHDVLERVAWRSFNGYGITHTWLHFRNGMLERWEVHAESN